MKKVGVRELKQRASEIVREVREAGASYEVTHRGRVVARLVPAMESAPEPFDVEKWSAEVDALGEEIAKKWPKGLTAVEAMREDRSRIEAVLGWEGPEDWKER